jgi:hypothetical protein
MPDKTQTAYPMEPGVSDSTSIGPPAAPVSAAVDRAFADKNALSFDRRFTIMKSSRNDSGRMSAISPVCL